MDDSDLDSFWTSADQRKRPLTRDEIIAYLEKKNSYRMWAIRYHLKWVSKQLKKMGLNPDDARELF